MTQLECTLIETRRAIGRLFLPCLLAVSIPSCSYRFSNLSPDLPAGLRTVAVEAVYDTSREVVPHEALWSAVQRQIVKSGHLILTSQQNADALITLWIQKARVSPSGTPSREPISKDPDVTESEKGRPEDFRNLRRAGAWTTDETVSLNVRVEMHDLKSRNLLKAQSYSLASNFKSLRPVTITSQASSNIQFEEALESKINEISKQLAERIISDFSL